MALTDFNKYKDIDVASVTGTPTISKAVPLKIVGGDDSTTGTGDIVLDWSNIATEADIGVYDETETLLDYYFESFDDTAEKAVIWTYRDWVRDGSTQLKIAYGNGPSDQSVVASTVFDKEANLQAGYLFNESSGDLLDVTSNNNDGTLNGGVTQGATGIVDGAYSFDGSDDFVNVSSNFFSTNTWYFAVWFKSTQSDDTETVLETYDGSFPQINILILNSADNYSLRCQIKDGTNQIKMFGPDNTDDGNWHRAILVRDGGTGYLYLDGTQVNTGTNNNVANDLSSDPFFGKRGDDVSHLDGLIDYIRIGNTVPSTDFINADYSATKSSPDFFSQGAGQTTGVSKAPGFFISNF